MQCFYVIGTTAESLLMRGFCPREIYNIVFVCGWDHNWVSFLRFLVVVHLCEVSVCRSSHVFGGPSPHTFALKVQVNLNPVSIAWNAWSIAHPPPPPPLNWVASPQQYSTVRYPFIHPVNHKERQWRKLSCLRKQCDQQDINCLATILPWWYFTRARGKS